MKKSKYIDTLFGAFVENKKEICIDLDIIDIDFDGIKNFLFSEENINLIKLSEICQLFKNCQDILVLGIKNINNGFMQELISMLDILEDLKHCNLERIELINVLYNNIVLDKGFVDDYQLKQWQFEVEIKYRSESEMRGQLKIPENSNLIITKKVDIKDDFVFNLLNDNDDYGGYENSVTINDVEVESESVDESGSSLVDIDQDFVNGLNFVDIDDNFFETIQ